LAFPRCDYVNRIQYLWKNTDMKALLLFGMPGGWEWVIIVVVVLVLFGGSKIPAFARGLGRGIREFKDGLKGGDESLPAKEGERKD
jgi:sec-independent protein translocase protein TatA